MRNKSCLLGICSSFSPCLWQASAKTRSIGSPLSIVLQRLAGQTNRLVLIEFYAPWCVVCKRMEADVVSQPSVAADIARKLRPSKD